MNWTRGLAVLCAGAGVAAAWAQSPYTAYEISYVPPGSPTASSHGRGIVPGKMGGFVDYGSTHSGLKWTGTLGSTLAVYTRAGYSLVSISKVSQNYEIGSVGNFDTLTHRASRWQGTAASWVSLHPAGAVSSSGKDIFESGGSLRAVGSAVYGSRREAVLWEGSSPAIRLNPAGSTWSEAQSVTLATQCGYATFGGSRHAIRWFGSATAFTDLHVYDYDHTEVLGQSGTQQVGFGVYDLTREHALMWNGTAASCVQLHSSSYQGSIARATNGTVQVGSVMPWFTGTHRARTWFGSSSSGVDLHARLAPLGTFVASTAHDIDANYNVIGTATDATGRHHAILWLYNPFV